MDEWAELMYHDDQLAEARRDAEAEAAQDEDCVLCVVCGETIWPDEEAHQVEDNDEYVCKSCLDEAEDAKAERQLEAREWAAYDAWEAKARMGVDEYGM